MRLDHEAGLWKPRSDEFNSLPAMTIDEIRSLSANWTKQLSDQELSAMAAIAARVRGYSGVKHYAFFRWLLTCLPVRKILVLGVYFGRDIAILAHIARAHDLSGVSITGVDRFSDEPCADWAPDKRDLSWRAAGFGMAPDLAAATRNLDGETGCSIRLVKSDDQVFLAQCDEKFDAIYIDTSHDHDTVCRQIDAGVRLLNEVGILAGDDYADRERWGVKAAVASRLRRHLVIAGWIWLSQRDELRPEAKPAEAG